MTIADLGPWLMGLAALVTAIAGLRSKSVEEWEKLSARLEKRVEALNQELTEKDERIDELEASDRKRGEEMRQVREDMRKLRQADYVKGQHVARVENLLALAIGYIGELRTKMEEQGIKPPEQPAELLKWLKEQQKE